jgi:hypothetical protein
MSAFRVWHSFCVDLQPRKYDLNVTPNEVASGGERIANVVATLIAVSSLADGLLLA